MPAGITEYLDHEIGRPVGHKGLAREVGQERIKKVSVNMTNIIPAAELQPELVNELPEEDLRFRAKWEKMSKALDAINQKYGRDSILIGSPQEQSKGFTGTKVAFTRIPDKQEFRE